MLQTKTALEASGTRFFGVCASREGMRLVINCATGEIYRCGQFLKFQGSYIFEILVGDVVMAVNSGGAGNA